MHWRRKWQPTLVSLPGESQGQRSLVGCHLWGRTESDTTEVTLQQQQQDQYPSWSINSCIIRLVLWPIQNIVANRLLRKIGCREKVTGTGKLKTLSQHPNWSLGIKTEIRARLGNFYIYSLQKIKTNAWFCISYLGYWEEQDTSSV